MKHFPTSAAGLRALAASLAALPCMVLAQSVAADSWTRADASLRLGFETVALPGAEGMGLLGTSYLVELQPGLCAGPAVYSAVSGQRGGFFIVGGEAAWCTRLIGPLSLEAGLYVGGGGGGSAPVGGGLMLRPHADLLWRFGAYRAGVSISRVRFPSGQIDSTQFGVVVSADTAFIYLPSGNTPVPYDGGGRTGLGFDRIVAVVGAYRPSAGTIGIGGVPLAAQIGYIGARAERFWTPNFYGGIETNGAASGGAAGYAEFLGTLGAEWTVVADRLSLGGRIALGMGGGGEVPVGGGLLGKAALDAQLRLSRDLSVKAEAGWAKAPQGSFSAPFASLGLSWNLDHAPGSARPPEVSLLPLGGTDAAGRRPQGHSEGQPTRFTRQEFIGGVETYHLAAREFGPPQSLQNVTLKFNRFLGDTFYLTGQVGSAYGGGAGGFAAGLVGLGAQARLGERLRLGAELLAGAAAGGNVASRGGAIVQPRVYVGLDLTPSMSLRLGAGQVKAARGPLDSTVLDLTLAFSFGVASRP